MLQIWPIPLRALLKYETFLLDQNAGKDLYFFFFFLFYTSTPAMEKKSDFLHFLSRSQ